MATTYVGTVYPWDCDQAGHMNVASYVRKFDEGTWQFFTRIGMDGAYFREKRGAMGAIEQNLSYERELYAGDCIEIHTEVLDVKPKAITFRHRMRRTGSDETVATCTITAVHIDTGTRRSSALPDPVFERANGFSPSDAAEDR